MLTLHTVSHAWQYERALAFHLSAYLLHPPETCQVCATIFYCSDDRPVVETLEFFCGLTLPPRVAIDIQLLPQPQLCRRAIGRDLAARATTADFILFSDVDYVYGPGALDAAAEQLAAANAGGTVLCHARTLLSSIDHAAGDAELARVDRPQLIEVEPAGYTPTPLRTAIGGSQWLSGDFARDRGYLPPGHRLLRPADSWQRTWEDAAARRYWGLPIRPLDVPNLYRLRHARRGRFDADCRN